MSSSIEPAVPADFFHIAALDRSSWVQTGLPYIADGEHIWRGWCEYATVLGARHAEAQPLSESGDVAGALVMFPTLTDELFLHKIMVHPDARGGGIGSELMRAALRRASAAVLLTVDPDNNAAVKLYRNFGFDVRERIDGYYREQEDRLLMVHPGGSAP